MSSKQLSFILRVTIKPEQREHFLQEMTRAMPLIRQQEGCLQAFLYEDANKPNKFIAIQTWASQEHLHTHIQSDIGGQVILLINTAIESSVEKIQLNNM